MTKENKKLILSFLIILIFIILLFLIPVPCLFKKVFNIPCPGCGLTRSFNAIINLNFIEAFNYNILGIPLFITIILLLIIIVIDVIKNTNNLEKIYNNILLNYYYIIIIFIIISWVVNIIRNI